MDILGRFRIMSCLRRHSHGDSAETQDFVATNQDVDDETTFATDAMEIVTGDYQEGNDQQSPGYQDISRRFTAEADVYGLDDIRNVRLRSHVYLMSMFLT